MIKIDKLYSTLKKDSLVLAISCAIFALIFWYQISPITFKDYDARCKASYSQSGEYDRCMNPYRSQVGLSTIELIVSLGLTVIFFSLLVKDQLLRKQKPS